MYGKIFTQIYEGTLASRGPWEALVTFQQLIVLANKHGEVDMTPEALSRRTTIPLEIIQKGIAALEQPDPESRTPNEDGKRIVRLDPCRPWGWKLVNYEKYRDIRSEEERREYQANWVRDKRAKIKRDAPAIGAVPVADGFDKFWEAYPRKTGKLEAKKSWRKVKPEEVAAILARVELNKNGEWKDCEARFIPHASKWLNGERWKDELAPVAPTLATADMVTARDIQPRRIQ